MTIFDIINITKGKVINEGNISKEFKAIKIDSRKLDEDDLFIALKGNNYNGHNFLNEAITKQVSGIIVDEDIKLTTTVPIIKVDNTYNSLIEIATYFRKEFDIPLVAVTGSVGKTTTKELINNILSSKYKVLKNIDNNNNHIGLPLTLFRLKPEHQIIVTELGMNHLGEISKLSNICKPDVAVITNIGTSHIGNLGSRKNIFKAKMEILDGMEFGNIVVNGDDSYLKKLKDNKKFKFYKCGIKKKNHLKAYNIRCTFEKTVFNLTIDAQEYEVTFYVPGRHQINNVLLAIKIGLMFKIDIKTIISIIGKYRSTDKRMNIIKLKNNNVLIEDCYNSCYESLVGVLELIKDIPRHKIIILGDILELGKYSRRIHLKIGRYVKKFKTTSILLVGKEVKVIKKRDRRFHNNSELINYLENIPIINSIILLKGSRKLRLEEIKAYLEKRY